MRIAFRRQRYVNSLVVLAVFETEMVVRPLARADSVRLPLGRAAPPRRLNMEVAFRHPFGEEAVKIGKVDRIVQRISGETRPKGAERIPAQERAKISGIRPCWRKKQPVGLGDDAEPAEVAQV